MKTKQLLLITLLAGSLTSFGQAEIPVPEFKNTIMLLEGNTLKDLERLTPTMTSKIKAFGAGGADVLFSADGTSSNVRLSPTELNFVFKMLDEETDPATIVKLIKVDVTKKNRSVKQSKQTMFGSSKAEEKLVALTFRKLKPGVYLITPKSESLVPGEYTLQVPLNYQEQASVSLAGANIAWFAFGID